MGTIVKPNTFADATVIDGSKWNGNFFTLFNEFNGVIENVNIKAGANIRGSKLKPNSIFGAKLAVPSIQEAALSYVYPGGICVCRTDQTKVRSVVGYKEFTYGDAGGGLGRVSVVTTFATDATISVPPGVDFSQGDPAFNTIPRVTIALFGNANLQNFYNITAVSTTQFAIELKCQGGVGLSGTLYWRAIGRTA